MSKKKVFCYNCAYLIKAHKHYPRGSDYYQWIPDACGNPDKVFGTKKVRATYKKPAHTITITISPEVINKRNDCTGWMFLAEKPEYSKSNKPWWKFWRSK